MRNILPILGFLALAHAADLTLRLMPSPNFDSRALPPSTHATLTTLGDQHAAPLTAAGDFVFHNVSAGSYLGDVHCSTHAFAPVRIDVAGGEEGKLVVEGWETYRGNDWENKGEVVSREGVVGVRCVGGKTYFMERTKFSVLTILKNPMILLGLVSMVIFLGMPYMLNNMDPEMRAEFEDRQKGNPMNSILSGQKSGTSAMGDFDMAGFLAGSKKETKELKNGVR